MKHINLFYLFLEIDSRCHRAFANQTKKKKKRPWPGNCLVVWRQKEGPERKRLSTAHMIARDDRYGFPLPRGKGTDHRRLIALPSTPSLPGPVVYAFIFPVRVRIPQLSPVYPPHIVNVPAFFLGPKQCSGPHGPTLQLNRLCPPLSPAKPLCVPLCNKRFCKAQFYPRLHVWTCSFLHRSVQAPRSD
ncbi:hypothetical protein BC939DRAFT_190538 [Gamsiella multidivaricata]|uniref:uncharacterized protein n=1 Tax=Gamsiella multidivaricata TaxID=101098 RepID=UPI00221E6E34|nr:uncharacterized protein BC939DRAFT_190538 [Gamsiella multidivaricata]KAI7831595.1 hypothetical protein BC939DRAFT_190538 [Gamsiella multidivaricata]